MALTRSPLKFTKTLPENVVIIDINNPKHAPGVVNYLAEIGQNNQLNCIVESTPRKGLHLWYKVFIQTCSNLRSVTAECLLKYSEKKRVQNG